VRRNHASTFGSFSDRVHPGAESTSRDYLKERHRADFLQAFAELTRQERNLLRLHLLEGLTLEQLGGHHRVHRTTVARWLDTASQERTAPLAT
jgi:RNA polymerase sigma-70 factor (ECF subfamily)